MAKLTKRTLDRAASKDRDYFVWCDELKGFGARILPGGQKSFVIQYRDEHRRSRRYTIGRYGHLTVEQARSEAMRKLGAIRFGENPAEEKRRKQSDMLMRDLCDQYIEDVKSGRYLTRFNRPKKATTIATDIGRIEAHVKPLLGNRPVSSIDRRTVENFLADVRAGKTGKRVKSGKPRGLTLVRGGDGTARRTLGFLGALMTYACDIGIRDDHPVRGVKRGVDNKRTRFFRESEYNTLGQALREAKAIGLNPTALNIIRALALSGCRLGEIATLKRREIDEQYGCLRFDDTKTGAQTRPAGVALFRLLNQLPVDRSTQYVFPATTGGGSFEGTRKVWLKVCALGQIEDATMHTLRHSYASVAAELNYSDATIAALLGHSLGTVTSRYTHFVDEALRAAADKVSNEIERRLGQPLSTS